MKKFTRNYLTEIFKMSVSAKKLFNTKAFELADVAKFREFNQTISCICTIPSLSK